MLADLDRQDGVPDKARDSYQRGLALREQLSLDGNTENRRRIREIVKSYQKMSSLYAVDDPAQAQSWIIKCISLLEPFVSDPQASEELELLNRCRTFLAIMHLSSQPSDATITK